MDEVALSEHDKMMLLKALTVANIHGDATTELNGDAKATI